MKTTITFEKAIELFNYLKTIDISVKDKLTYACGRLNEKLESVVKLYNKKLTDLSVEHAATDKDGTCAIDEKGNYKIDGKQQKEFNEKLEEIKKSETEFEPYLMKEPNMRAKNLPIPTLIAFNGYLFDIDIEQLYNADDVEDTKKEHIASVEGEGS